jgi:catechol 2,3-dioxygenase-like lactoylglutathione lyase family enzyme
MTEAATQSFNHVAMSVPADMLDEKGRQDILDFYAEVFGWTEMPTLTEDRKRLVLRAHSNEQFVFLHAEDEPMRGAAMDHFGLSVRTPEELDETLEKAQKYRERDDRVRIVDRQTEDFKVLKLHSFYVGYLLPLLVEVQCYEWAPGVGPQSLPDA